MPRIVAICRYPIKGLSAEPLPAVELAAGACLPLDRRFALARPSAPFDPEAPRWLAKTNFLMLMRDERLAELAVAYTDASGRLTVDRKDGRVLDVDLGTEAGRDAVEAFFQAFMGLDARPRLVEAPGHVFTDCARRYVSLINLETLRAL